MNLRDRMSHRVKNNLFPLPGMESQFFGSPLRSLPEHAAKTATSCATSYRTVKLCTHTHTHTHTHIYIYIYIYIYIHIYIYIYMYITIYTYNLANYETLRSLCPSRALSIGIYGIAPTLHRRYLHIRDCTL